MGFNAHARLGLVTGEGGESCGPSQARRRHGRAVGGAHLGADAGSVRAAERYLGARSGAARPAGGYRLDTKRIAITRSLLTALALGTLAAAPAGAHGIESALDPAKPPAFAVTAATASTDGRLTTFVMELAGAAGSVTPEPSGKLEGAKVAAYVWPTKLDPARVGFDAGSGILALAITAHPDFDDTPLFDGNADGDPANDGAGWHSRWIVLVEDAGCGAGLKLRDVSPGRDALPATAPMLPIALDSPGMSAILVGRTARITVPLGGTDSVGFDAGTVELQVGEAGVAPFLCVAGVHDVASGDLSLPGRITRAAD